MFRRTPLVVLIMLVGTAAALADPTVTLALESSKNGKVVRAGATIDWQIRAAVSPGDNAGLALISCDLLQNAANPAKLELPPADAASIDATMQSFDRPDGIANPGENTAPSGYIGVQRGSSGYKNLVQIGGAQNTFGAALPPGTGLGESATVIGGVGQGGTPQLVVSGSFRAPSTPGTYVFRLENGIANVLVQRNDPPAFSPVTAATANSAAASFTFTVGPVRQTPSQRTPESGDPQQVPPP